MLWADFVRIPIPDQQTTKTSVFIALLTLGDDQFIRCIWLAAPGGYLIKKNSYSIEAVMVHLVFHRTVESPFFSMWLYVYFVILWDLCKVFLWL